MMNLVKRAFWVLQIAGLSLVGADNFDSIMAKGNAADKKRNYAQAADFYADAVMAAQTPEAKQEALGRLGDCKKMIRDYSGAVQAYLDASKIPNKKAWKPLSYQRKAGMTLSRDMRNFQEGYDVLVSVVKKEKNSLALFYAVEAALKMNKIDKAQELINYGRSQTNPRGYFSFDLALCEAKVKIAQKDYLKAIKAYENIAAIKGVSNSQLSNMYGYIAEVYDRFLKDKMQARKNYEKCASFKVNNWHTRYAKRWLEQSCNK